MFAKTFSNFCFSTYGCLSYGPVVPHLFLLGWLELNQTQGSVKTNLGRLALMVVVNTINAYSFVAYPDLTYHLQNTGIDFYGCSLLPDNKETELGSSNQEFSPSLAKNASVVLVLCYA